jgi:vacuolar protein sorting-associated protein 13D
MQMANIQFNNLDIIANQETIVELLGFAKRVMPKSKSKSNHPTSSKVSKAIFEDAGEASVKTEITFDFHRLNVLILRAVMRDSFVVARKVGTFTMSDARIHASIDKIIQVEGSLGGLQVLDLTPEGINHQRIFSIGNDPLTDPQNDTIDHISSIGHDLYNLKNQSTHEDQCALSFRICRNVDAHINIKIRMGSLWFIHCARFMQELSWCATEFKHYLK